MLDDRTGTVWSHLDGRAVAGELEGTQLEIRALQTTAWASWLAEHPETTVPAVDTGYGYVRPPAGRPKRDPSRRPPEAGYRKVRWTDVGSFSSGPAMAFNTSPQSSADRHSGPSLSIVHDSAIAPYRLTRP